MVANAGGARFTDGLPITMDAEDVVDLRERTDATVLAVHVDAINHCLTTREDLRAALDAAAVGEVLLPDDGETVSVP